MEGLSSRICVIHVVVLTTVARFSIGEEQTASVLSAERRKKVSFMFAGCLPVWLAGRVDVLAVLPESGKYRLFLIPRPQHHRLPCSPSTRSHRITSTDPRAEQGKRGHHADSIAVVSTILRDIRAKPELGAFVSDAGAVEYLQSAAVDRQSWPCGVGVDLVFCIFCFSVRGRRCIQNNQP